MGTNAGIDSVGKLRRALAAGAVLAAVGVPAAGRVAHAAQPAVSFRDAAGIQVLSARRVDARQWALHVSSPALGRAVDVRVLLPTGYNPSAARRYPVLYLFHGTSGRASDWVTMGGAEATTARAPVITVMPDAGFDGDGGSWFTDWVDKTTILGPSRWESFHIAQVVPWVDANLKTVAARRGRAVAGVSQGGFGATSYAARHPDLFASVAAFSGAPEIDQDPDIIAGATAVIESTAYGLDGVQPDAMFGSRATNEINWRGHDPSTLMENLRATGIHLWTATGAPGPYDSTPSPAASGIEALTHDSTLHFHDRLVAAGIASDYHDYTYGTHTWAYWTRDLKQYLDPMLHDLGAATTPRTISYTSIDQRWSQWGWAVRMQRPAAQEFSALTHAGAAGFTVSGSGTAYVLTPALYRPGGTASVAVTGPAGTSTRQLTVSRDGRLQVTVPLGATSHAMTVSVRVRA